MSGSISMHQRVRVVKQGPDLNKIGSVTELTASAARVVLDDGSDKQSGGETPPATAKTFLLSEITPS